MPKQPNAGMKKVKLDWDYIDKCLESGCNGEMTAAAIGIHPQTLYNRVKEEKGMLFVDYLALKKRKGDSAIFLKQQELAAEKGDRGMLIWLGKNRLGQRDDPQLASVLKDELSKFNEFMEKKGESPKEEKQLEYQEEKKAEEILPNLDVIKKSDEFPKFEG